MKCPLLLIGLLSAALVGCDRSDTAELDALRKENAHLKAELKTGERPKLPQQLELIYRMESEEFSRNSADFTRESSRITAGMNYASEALKERARLDMESAEAKAAEHQAKITAMRQEFGKAGPSPFEIEQLKCYDERAGLRASIAFLDSEMVNAETTKIAELHGHREEKAKRLEQLNSEWNQVVQEGWKEHY